MNWIGSRKKMTTCKSSSGTIVIVYLYTYIWHSTYIDILYIVHSYVWSIYCRHLNGEDITSLNHRELMAIEDALDKGLASIRDKEASFRTTSYFLFWLKKFLNYKLYIDNIYIYIWHCPPFDVGWSYDCIQLHVITIWYM